MNCPPAVWNGAILFLFLAGCQRDLAPVSGRVTLDRQPLSGAVVTFQPKSTRDQGEPAAPGSTGKTDANGQYSLRLIHPDKPGAVIGEHVVTISAVSGGSEEAAATGPPLPKSWSDGSQRFKVPAGGTTAADFDITTPPARPK